MRTLALHLGAFALALGTVAGCTASSGDAGDDSSRSALSTSGMASLALANVGHHACQTNTLGGNGYESSCYGNGGLPEYWCADFVKWVWRNSGADVAGLNAAAGSFYVYGQNHGTLSNHPSVGAAVVYDYHGGGHADHVAIVTKVNADGTIETVSGDWNGEDGTEAHFSETSSVVINRPAYPGIVGTTPWVMGQTISGFIAPSGGGGSSGPPPSSDCSVHADHRLYCSNTPGAAMHADTTLGSGVVNHLRSTYSWFDCWGVGERHAGGNTTWYHTIGDDNPNAGWVPAVDLSTPDALDANPSAHGLARCGGGGTPPPPSDPSCDVRSDGKLHCLNTSGAAIRSSAHNGAAVVNHLRTSPSWFDCWTTGDMHAGGNTTWYHTLGDDNGNWGYVAAVDLHTSSAFDANPTNGGLVHCH